MLSAHTANHFSKEILKIKEQEKIEDQLEYYQEKINDAIIEGKMFVYIRDDMYPENLKILQKNHYKIFKTTKIGDIERLCISWLGKD